MTRRITWLQFINRLSVCLLWALGLGIALALTDKLVFLDLDTSLAAGLLLGAAAAAAMMITLLRSGVTPLGAAQEADRALALADRLASAVQLHDTNGPWADAVAMDADTRTDYAGWAEAVPYRPSSPARLCIPAAIVLGLVFALPPADLLGRMERTVDRRVAAQERAGRASEAIALAAAALDSTAGRADTPGRLRITLVRIRKDLLAGKTSASARAQWGSRLQQLAELMAEEDGGEELVSALLSAAQALAKGDKATAGLLQAAAEQLARLEEQLGNPQWRNARMRELAAKKQATLRSVDTALRGSKRALSGVEDADDLIELPARAREEEDRTPPTTGLIYSHHAAGAAVAAARLDYEQAARSAFAEVEAKRIPPQYARLVRDYFSSIRPAR